MQDGELFGVLGRLVGLSSGDLRLDAVIRLTCGRALKLKPLPCQVDLFDGKSECESVVAAFAEQFATDVSGIGDGQRKMLLSAAGDRALRIVTATFIADFLPRVWAGFEALGMGRPGNGPEVAWDPDTDPAQVLLAEFVPAVARLRKLDPVTTEVVRLRGATQHNCRLCKSLREEKALDAGGSEELYGDIERYESSSRLTNRHKAALRYVDALLWTPSDIDAQVARGVRKNFSESEAAELTLDVMRNAANKIAVALGADAARVESGTERYLVDEDGQTVFA
ncbi:MULTISPECIES: carboxymuconolactone decarboxylase family protein [Mycolicibacterium]|uniref:Carboxymuconolactone decarboxylase family protein n=2 Tax=Mycolicibacterium TaxID=1866885 RepID=A0A9X2YNC8_9MYCO|nr:MULTISPECIES: carboxymuconolactone decarboxylase family protein [Mycolicibacterium]MCV7170530.1 carboxymuconolactone decarboxylase family protein [[Mycobacterium] manitobense]MDO3637758.1 carboxymuconolactone decarboxylase family protein [Mycolicibacterium arseniciresistens]